MESLKQLSEVTEPDGRQKAFVGLDMTNGAIRPFTLEDFHRRAASIELHSGVPEKIRDHFETACHLVIYSWFYYPFNITAQLAAYTSVEFALRTKFQDNQSIFKVLLERAVDSGLITDRGFSITTQRAERIKEYNQGLPSEFQLPENPLVDEYSRQLIQSIRFLRNEIAHGTTMLHHNGASTVRTCAELINQLFPNPNPKQPQVDTSVPSGQPV
jgi:hypothetical protein